jgi:two-component system NtrC family response regulator
MDRILVVDDDQTWRIILGDRLRSVGYYVDTVSSLAEAMGKLEDEFYHVVITDISLDQEKAWNDDGVRLLKWIRERCPSSKTIAISGRSVSGLDKTGFKAEYGALEYIERTDFEPQQFLEYVAKAVQLSKEAIGKG